MSEVNGFQKHGLKHSSPSSLNMWASAPCAWIARYLFDKKLSFGVAAQIGVLTETVIVDTLCGASFDESLTAAKKKFLKDNALNTSMKDRERIDDIEAMANQALEYLKPLGEPEFKHTIKGREQQSISLLCNGDGWELPIIGFLDLVYPKEGLIIDIKTTLRIPSELSPAHARQGAIYSKAKGNMACKMLYCSPKKYAVHSVDDVNGVLAETKTILNRQEKMLRLHDKETLKEIIPVASDSFYWMNDYKIRKDLYGV